MTTKKATHKPAPAKKADKMTTKKAPAKKADKPLTVEEKLDGLIAYLKDHGIHYDGSAAPKEEVENEGEPKE